MFELDGVSLARGGSVSLQTTHLGVLEGEVLVLLGPSGSGKSTLVRLLMGLETPTTGVARFRGRPLPELEPQTFRRQLGYVVQGGGLFPHLTAEGNVTLVARFLRWGDSRIQERLSELVTLTRFPGDALARRPARLSGGERQRVSLMRALMLDPEVLLLDEPLGALDPITRGELQRDLGDIFARLHKTVVLVTHDLYEARAFATRIALLREGRVLQTGTFEELRDSPADAFVSRFLGAQSAQGARSADVGAPEVS
jgi:osmoprotectant transport system ATP-binding protein